MEEEYTFIVDLSSRTQLAQCRCSCTTTRPACQSRWRGLKSWRDLTLGLKWKRAAEGSTHCTFRKERAAGVVPAFTFCCRQESSALYWSLKHHFQESSRPTLGWLNSGPNAQTQSLCAYCFSIGVALSVWRKSLVFICLFSACVTAKVQTMCGSMRGSTGVSANGLKVLTKSAWMTDNDKLIKKRPRRSNSK